MNTNRILIVPDVHGRTFWRSVLDNKEDTIVFLGDYTDPYENEGFTYEDSVCELEDIIQFKKDNPKRVFLLLGNHDFHYLYPTYACTRFNSKFFDRYKALFINNLVFKIALQIDNYLFTHAGVSHDWLKRITLTDDNQSVANKLNDLFERNPASYSEYGSKRGYSLYKTGSPIWCDLREHAAEYQNGYPELTQIFGHTQMQVDGQFYKHKNMWCIDSRKVFVLENDDLCIYN